MKNSTLAALGIRGKVGNVVFKKYRNGIVVTKYPDMSHAGCSARQREQRNTFKLAVTKAKAIMKNPELRKYYENLPGNGSAWNKILTELMKEL